MTQIIDTATSSLRSPAALLEKTLNSAIKLLFFSNFPTSVRKPLPLLFSTALAPYTVVINIMNSLSNYLLSFS